MSSKLHVDHDAPLAEINVTPLVDVMLVLLVIFMILSPLFAQALRVNLPAVDAPALSEPEILDVVVHPDGRIECAGQVVSLDALAARVKQETSREPEIVLRLGADEATDYKHVAAVIAALQRAGGERLAFATQGGEGGRPAELAR